MRLINSLVTIISFEKISLKFKIHCEIENKNFTINDITKNVILDSFLLPTVLNICFAH